MYFYSIDSSNAVLIELKGLVNLLLFEPLVEELKHDEVEHGIVLWERAGSESRV